MAAELLESYRAIRAHSLELLADGAADSVTRELVELALHRRRRLCRAGLLAGRRMGLAGAGCFARSLTTAPRR
jgi:hypothetical protein